MALKDPKREDTDLSTVEGQGGQEGALPPEVKRRYEAYKAGKTKPISLEELFSDL
jgi:hypothetical protein